MENNELLDTVSAANQRLLAENKTLKTELCKREYLIDDLKRKLREQARQSEEIRRDHFFHQSEIVRLRRQVEALKDTRGF